MEKITSTLTILFFTFFTTLLNAQFVSQQNGVWNDGATWGNNSPGVVGIDYPSQTDDLIIQGGHLVVIDNLTDNGGPAISPEGLGLANVGDGIVDGSASFPSAERLMFYHTGNITIVANSELEVNRRIILGGTTRVEGRFTADSDVVNLGALRSSGSAVLDIGDDFIMTGNSITDIDGALMTIDDLFIDHLDAIIGGSGTLEIDDDIQTYNGNDHDPTNQICISFKIDCGDDCNPSVLGDQRSIVGTSNHPVCFDLFPVEFETIQAHLLSRNEVNVSWTTGTETNNDRFEVERSVDGVRWDLIGTVAGAGTTGEAMAYKLVDYNPTEGNLYYRIKQVDYDGSFSYSNSVVVFIDKIKEGILDVAPNPIQANQTLNFFNAASIEWIEIFNQYGSRVKTIERVNRQLKMDFGTGVFNLRMKTKESWTVRRIVVL